MKWLTYSLMLAAAVPLAAGVRVQMESTDLNNNSTEQSEILLDAGRLRMNAPDTSMMFVTEGGRRMMILDKSRNEARVMDQATMDKLAAQLGGAMAQLEATMANLPPEQRAMMERMMKGKMGAMIPGGAQQAAAPKTVYTQTGSATVNGFSCTQYSGVLSGQKVAEVCAASPSALNMNASDFGVFDEMRQFMTSMLDTLKNSPMGGAMSGMVSNPMADLGFDGFPVQRTGFENGQAKSRDEIKSVDQASFTDADFSFGDAKVVDMIPPGTFPGQ